MSRLLAYAEAFGISIPDIGKASEKQLNPAENSANSVSTTGTVRDRMTELKDGEMLVIPIGGDTGDFE